jgi:hypothetical protein
VGDESNDHSHEVHPVVLVWVDLWEAMALPMSAINLNNKF